MGGDMPDYHLFVCTGPTCRQEGAEETLHRLQEALQCQPLAAVRVTLCRCLGQCGLGPNMVVYPGGTWYGRLHVEEIDQVIASHLMAGRPVASLIQPPPPPNNTVREPL